MRITRLQRMNTWDFQLEQSWLTPIFFFFGYKYFTRRVRRNFRELKSAARENKHPQVLFTMGVRGRTELASSSFSFTGSGGICFISSGKSWKLHYKVQNQTVYFSKLLTKISDNLYNEKGKAKYPYWWWFFFLTFFFFGLIIDHHK